MSTDIASQTEQAVREYFETPDGWTVKKLDKGNIEQAADFRVCYPDSCFLCEVKTISSVHANIPYSARNDVHEYFLEQRRKKQEQTRRSQEDNPDVRVIMSPAQYEDVFGDDDKTYLQKRDTQQRTEFHFRKFKEAVKNYLEASSVSSLPYLVRLDSDSLYVPNPKEREAFFTSLERQIQAIHDGKPDRLWHVSNTVGSNLPFYTCFYPIHTPDPKSPSADNVKHTYQLMIYNILRPPLYVDAHSYGGLNLDAITRNVEAAVKQLKSIVGKEENQQIPRIVVLAFESGIGSPDDWQTLSSHMEWLLQEHPTLSAVAVLRPTPDGEPPLPEEGWFAMMRFLETTPWVTSFVVYHNQQLDENVHPLPRTAFHDRWTIHK
ncbi:MAG: hypothetical protein L0332_25545 [Chloroflexi bacterium]|nr:hypothetical protein [Chloroflexota bacterium]MCI0730063.1 hypothetical protein [Chloroflexota bacterium]